MYSIVVSSEGVIALHDFSYHCSCYQWSLKKLAKTSNQAKHKITYTHTEAFTKELNLSICVCVHAMD